MIPTILFIVAVVLFGAAAINLPQNKINYVGAGLFCLTLAFLLARLIR